MNCEEAGQLFPDDWNGTLSERESAELAAHVTDCAPCRVRSERLRGLWKSLGAIPFDEPSPGVRERFYDALAAYGEGQAAARATQTIASQTPNETRTRPRWFWQAGLAAAAALVVGVGLGYSMRGASNSGMWNAGAGSAGAGSQEIAGLRTEVNGLRQLVALSLLQTESASDRLRGVTFANQVERSDARMPAALLESVNQDPNVNVRLAAADALRTFSLTAEDRARIADAISRQSSPLVQIALIDLAAELKDAAAVAKLQAIAADANYNPSVRERARWALEKLQ